MTYQNIPCALCRTDDNYRVRYPARILGGTVNISPRRIPEGTHHQIVKCQSCGLIYSNPLLSDFFSSDNIIESYRESEFTDEPQLKNMGEDYLQQLRRVTQFLDRKERLLEVGCANGFFLRRAQRFGFKDVFGVETCRDAIRKAHPETQPYIVESEFKPGLFEENFFDVICCFQTLDHLLDPNRFLDLARKLLRKRGIVFGVNHNIRSFVVRLLGERSPLYLMEHIYLFDVSTIKKLLQNHHFNVLFAHGISNAYTLEYCLRLFPFPLPLRNFLIQTFRKSGLSERCVRLRGGNMVWAAQKDAD